MPSIEESIETLKELSALVGRERVAWRYDPVLLTREYTIRPPSGHLPVDGQGAGSLY